jgi:hypothetical protein
MPRNNTAQLINELVNKQHLIDHLRLCLEGHKWKRSTIPCAFTLSALGFEDDEVDEIKSFLQSILDATEKMYSTCIDDTGIVLNLDIKVKYSSSNHDCLEYSKFLYPFWRDFFKALKGYQATLLLADRSKGENSVKSITPLHYDQHVKEETLSFHHVQHLVLANIELNANVINLMHGAIGKENYFGSISLINNNIYRHSFGMLMDIIKESREVEEFRFEKNKIPDIQSFAETINSLMLLKKLVLRGQTSATLMRVCNKLEGHLEQLFLLDRKNMSEFLF